jgi:hypothetical protein|tara:strand:+ start:9619 stop:9831 length:213 start_codon:yes stop_codon:yes gene_type:complete
MELLEKLYATGLEADIGMMASHFGVSETDFLNQVMDSLKDESQEHANSLQRISERIEAFKKKPNLTLVTS